MLLLKPDHANKQKLDSTTRPKLLDEAVKKKKRQKRASDGASAVINPPVYKPLLRSSPWSTVRKIHIRVGLR